MFESASSFDREADHEMQRVGAKDGGIFLRLGPDAVLVVTEDNNVRLGTEGFEHFILFNGEDTHGRNSFCNSFGPKGAILREANFNVGILGCNAGFLLAEAGHPRGTVWVAWLEGREEGPVTFAFEIDGTDV